MSQNASNVKQPSIEIPEGLTDDLVKVKKPSFVSKTKTFVKTHKKTTIAVAALTGLVVVSALAGRKTTTLTIDVQAPLVIETEETADEQE